MVVATAEDARSAGSSGTSEEAGRDWQANERLSPALVAWASSRCSSQSSGSCGVGAMPDGAGTRAEADVRAELVKGLVTGCDSSSSGEMLGREAGLSRGLGDGASAWGVRAARVRSDDATRVSEFVTLWRRRGCQSRMSDCSEKLLLVLPPLLVLLPYRLVLLLRLLLVLLVLLLESMWLCMEVSSRCC